MLGKVKPENVDTYLNKIERLFPEFKSDRRPDLEDIKKYYKDSFLGYLLFHSWEGAIHMALSRNGSFSKNDYFRQAEEVGDIIEQRNEGTSALRIAEYGCGRAFNIKYLAERFKPWSFLGVDVSEKNISSGQKLLKTSSNSEVQLGDFHNLSEIPSESFDAAFCVETLCHAEDLHLVLNSIHRTLKDNASFVVFDGFRASASAPTESLKKAVKYTERAMAVPQFFTSQYFIETAEKCGFEVEEVEDRSAEIMPNLIRLSDLAKAFFKVHFISKLIVALLPKALVTNSIAGLLMAVTVDSGAHQYKKLTMRKRHNKPS